MKRTLIRAGAVLCGLALSCTLQWAQVPRLLNYQGRVTAGGIPFNGSGSFKFALVNGTGTPYWLNSIDTTPADNVPDAAVLLTVSRGVYSVLLGDSTVPNMAAVPSSVFDNSDVRLRVWFNDGVTGFQQLTPDQRLAAAPYAINAANGFLWQLVTTTAQQAQSNVGYLTTNDATQVTITLPSAPSVGDRVRVSSSGLAGWKIAQNASQSILTMNLGGVVSTWTSRDSVRAWQSIASSSDGTKLVAVVNGGQIYTSTDSGATWTPRDSGRAWSSVASSSDGVKLVAAEDGGKIYTSVDSGANWTPRDSARPWTSVASSSDGVKLVATEWTGQIYTSINSGANWTPRDSARSWTSVASSSDGTKLVAAENGGFIYTSTDSGVTWTPRDSARYWNAVVSSSDGTKLVACEDGGRIYTSSNSGVNWTARESKRAWNSLASSSDGTKLIASDYGGPLYASSDSGLSWIPRETARAWASLTSSSDGSKLAAAVASGNIFTSVPFTTGPTTTAGTTGFLSGAAYSAIELQFVGNNRWLPISVAGSVGSN